MMSGLENWFHKKKNGWNEEVQVGFWWNKSRYHVY